MFRQELNEEILKVDVNNAESSELIKAVISILEKHTPESKNKKRQIIVHL